MSNRISTRYHNIKVLAELGYDKIENTTVFTNGTRHIISPAVGDANWFNIREVNLKRARGDFLLLVRVVSDRFILVDSKKLESLLPEKLKDNRPHSGNVWDIKLNDRRENTSLYNVKNRYATLPVKLLNKQEMLAEFMRLRPDCAIN